MKRALVRADGFITNIAEEGEEFEVYTGPGSGLKWIDMDDHEIALWYNQFDQCMLSQGRLDSFNPQKSYNYCYKYNSF